MHEAGRPEANSRDCDGLGTRPRPHQTGWSRRARAGHRGRGWTRGKPRSQRGPARPRKDVCEADSRADLERSRLRGLRETSCSCSFPATADGLRRRHRGQQMGNTRFVDSRFRPTQPALGGPVIAGFQPPPSLAITPQIAFARRGLRVRFSSSPQTRMSRIPGPPVVVGSSSTCPRD